jgi:hypothetical protein
MKIFQSLFLFLALIIIKKKQHTVGTVPKSNIKTGCYLNDPKP